VDRKRARYCSINPPSFLIIIVATGSWSLTPSPCPRYSYGPRKDKRRVYRANGTRGPPGRALCCVAFFELFFILSSSSPEPTWLRLVTCDPPHPFTLSSFWLFQVDGERCVAWGRANSTKLVPVVVGPRPCQKRPLLIRPWSFISLPISRGPATAVLS
jgi:hypothetical protein